MVGAKLVRLLVSGKLLDDGKPIGLLAWQARGRASLCNAHSGRTVEYPTFEVATERL